MVLNQKTQGSVQVIFINQLMMRMFMFAKYINIFIIIFFVLLECLEHLATMIEDYGTSICQPSVAAACKEIAKSIGDRDNSVRTAALNCFVAAFFLHGEALFKFVGNV